MKIYNLEAFVFGLLVMVIAAVMLILGRGDTAVWVGLISGIMGVYVKSPLDWDSSRE